MRYLQHHEAGPDARVPWYLGDHAAHVHAHNISFGIRLACPASLLHAGHVATDVWVVVARVARIFQDEDVHACSITQEADTGKLPLSTIGVADQKLHMGVWFTRKHRGHWKTGQ